MELSFELGTFPLTIIAFVFLLLTRYLCKRDNLSEEIGVIDRMMLFGLLARALWAIAVSILSSYGYHYFVWDDESYHKFAMHQLNESQLYSIVLYNYILRFLYDVFGRTSLTGRVINLFLSLSTIYPLASIEKRLNRYTRFSATKMMAYSPFMIFVSFFEIKDIFVMFMFIAAYAMVKRLQEGFNIATLFLLICFGVILEQFRSGTGVIPIAVYILSIIRPLGVTKIQRAFFVMCSTVIIGITVFYVGHSYFMDQADNLDRYQRWIYTQFSSDSFYNWLVIARIQDIWKAPICFVLYVMQPSDALVGSGRFFSDFGMIAKIIDVPIVVTSLVFLLKYIKKEKWNSLLFVILYSFMSCINLTNARQGLFLYPIMYLMFFDGMVSMTEYEYADDGTKKIYIDRSKRWKQFVLMFSIVWLLFVIYRIVK